MINLSHLTEEEQEKIMVVLRRDAELKKAEEDRIRKLEKILDGGSHPEPKLKCLSGEWFYEVKSRRHTDKIHGSEIILASMKHWKAADGSPTAERVKTPSTQGSNVATPPKPARSWEALKPQEIKDGDGLSQSSARRSQRMSRHNPFDRSSIIVYEPPENNDVPTIKDQRFGPEEQECKSPLKTAPAGDGSQNSGGSITSEGSSVGLRPVPKKRKFLSNYSSHQAESSGLSLDTREGSEELPPAPRQSLQQGPLESPNLSLLKSPDDRPQPEMPEIGALQLSSQPSSSADKAFQEPLFDVFQKSSPERERTPPTTRDRLTTYTRGDGSTEREERDDQAQRESNTFILPTSNIQDSNKETNSSVATAAKQEDLSITQSTVDPDPPVSYDLNFIDKSNQQKQKKSKQKHVLKLSPQATSPTGDDGDSIAKVLDWFSRSTDSNDWLDTEDEYESSDKHAEISKLRSEDSLTNDAGEFESDEKRETPEMKRSLLQRQISEAKDSIATDGTDNKEQSETQEDVLKEIQSQQLKDNDNEYQAANISHLKSFWEQCTTGPKVTSKSVTSSNKEQKLVHLSAQKDEENMNKPHEMSDMTPGMYSERGIYDDYTSKHGEEREQKFVTSAHNDTEDSVHLNNQHTDSLVINTSTQINNNDPILSSNNLKSPSSPKVADRNDSDMEILGVTSLEPKPATQSRVSPEWESISTVKPDLGSDSVSQSRETSQQEEPSVTIPLSQLGTDLQRKDGPDSKKLCLSRNKQGGFSAQIVPKAQAQAHRLSEDIKRMDSEDKNMQSSTSPRKIEEESSKDRTNSPHQESTAEKIKQLKSFWEQDKNKPMPYNDKPKSLGPKLNKRLTKSEYDLSSVGNGLGSNEDDSNRNQHTVAPLNRTTEILSPGLSRTQFDTLREFWDAGKSDTKESVSFVKPQSPKTKQPVNAQCPPQELQCDDPKIYHTSPTVETTTPAALKSTPPLQKQSNLPHDKLMGSGTTVNDSKKNHNQSSYTTAESRRSSKDSNTEENSTKPKSSSGKQTHSPKSKKESLSNLSSGGNSLLHSTSMFALSDADEIDQGQIEMDSSHVHSQSKKQTQNTEKDVILRSSSKETETPIPRARTFVPKHNQHCLGITDTTSVPTSLSLAVKDEGSEGKSECEVDLSSPLTASTPVSSGGRYSRKAYQKSRRCAYNSSSDTGQESPVSSTSETWSNSRSSSNRDDDSQHPVRKALRRAQARPKYLAKSMGDITASLSPQEERKHGTTADMRRSSEVNLPLVSSIPSSSSPLFSDPDHLKKMSKSVPSFIEKEDADNDSSEDSYYQGRPKIGRSMTNLTNSSGKASMSSLSGSVMTVYSGDFGNIDVQGNIQFSISYIQKLKEFHIFVAECRNLAAVDLKRGRSNPYVKTYLVPDKANLGKRKTSVKKKTLNPTFNEILRYRVSEEDLRAQTLILSVWHHDTFGRNSFLGEVDVDLSKWYSDHPQMNDLALKARTTPSLGPSNVRGQMRLAVRFLPQIARSEGKAKDGENIGEIHIWVKECKNLPLIRATIDPYVKCFLLPDTSRKSRQKTRVLRRTVNPVFNHTMVYDGLREADLQEACLELTVWDRDKLASNLLGGVRLGAGTGRSYGALVDWMDSASCEVALWERMIASPNEWVEDMLPLRMMNSTKTTLK